jgi:heme exporter protein A
LWVLDEPFVALDVKAVDGLRGLLAEHLANGGMVLFTSHQSVALTSTSGTSVDMQIYRLRGVA